MKILLVQSTLYVPTHGGENKANRLLVEGLAARGHSCRVAAPAIGAQGPGTRAQFLEELAHRGLRLEFSDAGADVFEQVGVQVRAVTDSSQLRSHLLNQIREFDPNWILVSSEDPGQVLLEAALEAAPAKVVYLAHTMLFFPFGPHCFLPDARKTELFKKLAGIITVSNYLKDYIREWSGCESTVIPFPVYGSGPFPRFGSFDKGFVTMINPCAYKGISIFLALARKMPQVQYAAVPSWGTTKDDRASLEELPNVRLLKATDGIDEIFAQTRVLLVPSLWAEGFPLVPVEAMLRGIPVMASNSTGLPESMLGVDYVLPVRTIEHYEHDFDDQKLPIPIVPKQDLGPWEQTLHRLVSDRKHYEQLSAASRNAALAFNFNLSVEPFEDFLENLKPANQIAVPAAVNHNQEVQVRSKTDDLVKNLSKLSPDRRALLALRLQKKTQQDDKKDEKITRRHESDPTPISFAQERLWFLEQWQPGNPAYINLDAFRLTGRCHQGALEKSLNEIVRRHEVLRAIFLTVDGKPIQVIAPVLRVQLEVVDLSGLADSERELQTECLIAEEAKCPFDLAQGPLFRARLLKLGVEDHILLLAMHHIISDGWSGGILFNELALLYEAFTRDKNSPLPDLPLQYGDFAQWQRERLRGEALERQLTYWKKQLSNAPALLGLPTDRPRPAAPSLRGGRQSILLPPSLTQALKDLSKRCEVTLFMTLLAAFKTLLYRYSGQEDIVVGSPIAGRNRTEIEGLIGLFVNQLILRTRLSAKLTFRELLRRVRAMALEAYAHQDVPFEKLVGELRPERSPSHAPLFQVMFVLQNTPRQALALSGLTLSTLEVHNESAKFDLTLDVVERADGLSCALEYSSDLFEATTVRQMLTHFQVLLLGIVSDPEQRLSQLPLLTEDDRHRMVVQFNNTETAYSDNKCVHDLFEEQVERTPQAAAVVYEDRQLSYAELNSRANRLARHLRDLGVTSETLVGISLERSVDLLVGLLGILKAGGAYVPLDPSFPPERLSFMLRDAEVAVLITERGPLRTLPASTAHVVCLDDDWTKIARHSDKNLERAAEAENLAYIIYTSGSTGRPKGVQIEHSAVVNFLAAMQKELELQQGDRLLAVTTLSFDIAGLELYLPLMVGATVEMANRQVAADGAQLIKRVAGASVMQATPATWRLMLDAGWKGNAALKILCGGEALPRELAEKLSERGSAVWNLYGPTETTIWSTGSMLKRGNEAPSIGRPIANTEVYLLDQELGLVPIGVPGELHIGGAGLARGYLKRPDLTAERFIANPWGKQAGARLYKTGDLARYRHSGEIEYLGRLDHQVKIRGFRIELGEIEAQLATFPGVQEAVVVAREDAPGEKRLVSYLVAAQMPAPTVSELRTYLKEKLPEYMVPSSFVFLDSLPLTQNGKVDRKALPARDDARPDLKETFVAPKTAVEKVLAKIWRGVLGVAEVGGRDNFFELGGHSLLATQIMSRLREAFQIDLPVRTLFESPTICGLAAQVEASALLKGDQLDVSTSQAIQRRTVFSPAPTSFAQQRLWFLDGFEPSNPFYNILIALRLKGPLDVVALERSIKGIVARHEALRTTFANAGGTPVQVIAANLPIAMPAVELAELPETDREATVRGLAIEFVQQPFDLGSGPLIRTALLRLSVEEHALLISLHHIVSDGWSIGIFMRELATHYDAFSHGDPCPLADLPVQYADYALWQKEWLRAEVLELELAYWRQQLSGAPQLLRLPTDRPRPDSRTQSGATEKWMLPRSLSESIMALGRREEATLFMTLLTAFQVLLAHYSGDHDIVVGTDVANRNRVEIEGLIGFFVNQLVMRTDLSGDPTFRESLRRVREVALGAYAHQDVPFDKVVEVLRPERSLSYTPLFQAKLVLQNAPTQTLQLSGLELSFIEAHSGTVKFDLLLSVWETETGLSGMLEYATDLFEPATIKRMLGHLELLLASVVLEPDIKLSAITEILNKADLQEQIARQKELQETRFHKVTKVKRKLVYATTETENAG